MRLPGSRVPKKVKRRIEIWTSDEQHGSYSRGAVLRSANARYPEVRAEDMRRRQVELERSTAWAIARNEAAARGPLNLPYIPTSPDVGGCTCVVSSDDDLFDSDS